MTINSDRFKFENLKLKHLPYRERQDFIAWRIKNNLTDKFVPNELEPGENFDIKKPVFKSVRSLVEYARAIPGFAYSPDEESEAKSLRASQRANRDWCWGFNLNDTFALYDRGWAEGLDAINHRIEAVASAAMTAAMKEIVPQRDLHGSFIDIDAFIQGNPECLFEFQETVQPQLHLTLEIDSFVQWNVEAEEVLSRGLAISAAIMALRRCGVFVTAYKSEKSRPTSSIFRREHRYQAPEVIMHIMNPDLTENLTETLMALCHPAFHRNIFFHAYSVMYATDEKGVMMLARSSDEYYPKQGSGKIVIPGQFWSRSSLDSFGIDWHNSWASPKAAEDLVKMLFKCATPR